MNQPVPQPKKYSINKELQFIIALFMIFYISNSTAQNIQSTPSEILTKVLASEKLWQEIPSAAQNVSTYYIMNHGVDLKIAPGTMINGKSISLINKSDIDNLNGEPYFLFHTLNIESSKALIRSYLVHQTEEGEKTEFGEFSFINQNGHWTLATTSL